MAQKEGFELYRSRKLRKNRINEVTDNKGFAGSLVNGC